MADRLISADALAKKAQPMEMYDNDGIPYAVMAVTLFAVEDAPTVDAVEVVHGEWSTIEDDYTGLVALQCSVCNQEYWFEDEPPTKIYNYCPNCGAKMDGDGND